MKIRHEKKREVKKMKWKLILTISAVCLTVGMVAIFSTLSAAQNGESYPYRPICNASVQGNDGSPLSVPLPPLYEKWDSGDRQKYCYINSTLLYIQQDLTWGHSTDPWGNIIDVRPEITHPDFYKNNIGFNNDFSIGHPQNPVTVRFRYYIPKWPIPSQWQPYFGGKTEDCFNDTQVRFYTFLGNDDSDTFSETDFETGDYKFAYNDKLCEEWKLFSHVAGDFENRFGTSFSHAVKVVGAIDFEMANIYIDLSSIEMCGVLGGNPYCEPVI